MTQLEDLTDEQMERYARHLVLPEVEEDGQLRLLNSSVLVIGAGGLGSPLLLYLAAAGVGTIGIVDDDSVERSNLQRQIVHSEESLGTTKVASAQKRLQALNPDLRIVIHETRITADNAQEIIADYDLVADGCDTIATRYVLNDACFARKKTLVSAAILRFDGQITTIKAHEPGNNPCYRCLFGNDQPDGRDSCADVGVFGALAGTMGSLQAVEVIKELLGIGTSLSGRLMLYSALDAQFHSMNTRRDPACPVCGGVE
ncbi:HesA/MoeB/ThiF family protein [Kiloniella sp. b19]|uniref:HesA/MoeB/ThiF family protein n=1 Tax=Kiloniella sp. GXU_MW_B19 TaxID=3141326 RepID=UPI0031E34A4F